MLITAMLYLRTKYFFCSPPALVLWFSMYTKCCSSHSHAELVVNIKASLCIKMAYIFLYYTKM